MRASEIKRDTAETKITLALNVDGEGKAEISSGCGFLDHMLTLFTKHGCFDLSLTCRGDVEVDYHHTAEDIAICLGSAFREAMGDKRGIMRYADTTLPMDEALILSAVDISGRGGLYYAVDIPTERVGDFDSELCEEFWCAFCRESGVTLHIRQLCGKNSHHIIEGIYKSVARSLRAALAIDGRNADKIPSTKGTL